MGKGEENIKSNTGEPTREPVQQTGNSNSSNVIRHPTELSWNGNMGENWRFFKQKFQIYLAASRCTDENSKYKIALLLNSIGDRALKIFNNFTYDPADDKDNFETVLKKFDSYFLPEVNETYERHTFFLREQKPDETVDQYVTDLRDLSSSCNFGNLTDNLIRDRIILGIRDRAIKDRLLRVKDLDLNKALEVCRAAERTKTQLADICPNNEVCKVTKFRQLKDGSGKSVNRPSGSKPNWSKYSDKQAPGTWNRNKFQKPCSKCGYEHPRFKCPAFGKRCNYCKRSNHFASQCRNNKAVNLVETSEDFFIDGIEANFVNKLSQRPSPSEEKEWTVDLEINHNRISFNPLSVNRPVSGGHVWATSVNRPIPGVRAFPYFSLILYSTSARIVSLSIPTESGVSGLHAN